MIRTRARGVLLLATSALALTLVSGCGPFGSSSTTSTRNASGQSTVPSNVPGLIAKNVGNLGSVVTDRDGMTLYRFDKDTSNPPASNCEGQCAQTWPPFTTTANQIHLEGVDQKLVGTIARKDGSVQITLGGWPLYRYAKDTAPGEVKGQGVGQTWFAATPAGKKAAGSAPPANNAPTDSSTANDPAANDPAANDQAPADNSGGSGY